MRRVSLFAIALALAAALMPAAQAEDFHIVNGTEAEEGAYPWMAAFLFDGGQGCGASVIREQWILTAAHCVADDRGQLSTQPASASFVVNTTNYTTGGDTLTAAEIIIHPNYDAVTTNNDIALVRTNETTDVTPVRLATAGDADLYPPGTTTRVIGYGTIRTGGEASEQLLQVDVPVISDDDCRAQGYGQLVDATMICAGAPTPDSNAPGNDSCQGDSGGPIFVMDGEAPVQYGVVSFGGECGVDSPGVYAEVATYTDWINGIVGGAIEAGEPDPGTGGETPEGAAAPAFRLAAGDGNDPVANAIEVSQAVFQQQATVGILAASANFPDALGGSSLGFLGPLLYVDADGTMSDDVLLEFQRAVDAEEGVIVILGGNAAVDPGVDAMLEAEGFQVQRLAGGGRQDTAKLVADLTLEFYEGNILGSAIIAFEGNWPDAVGVGQISSFWGTPILLTPTNSLGGPAAEFLTEQVALDALQTVYVVGGPAVVSEDVVVQIEAITGEGSVVRLGGADRNATLAQINTENSQALFPQSEEIFGEDFPIEIVVAANINREDAFAHLLAMAPFMGNLGAVVAPVSVSGQNAAALDSICGTNAQVVVIGGTELVSDDAVAQIQQASAGEGCTAPS